MFKLIGSFMGFLILRSFWGVVIGFFIGSMIDRMIKGNTASKETPQATYDYYHRQSTQYDFATMIMVLSAAVMKADGKPLKSELDFIKSFFTQQFGNQFNTAHLKALKHFLETPQIPLQQICSDISLRINAEGRNLLTHYLFGIAQSDGEIAEVELQVIRQIAGYLGLSTAEFESIQNMFIHKTDSDYKILELEKTATDDEIRKAYRAMALKYHPDRVASLGAEYQQRAKEKFQRVQQAYENIKKERGFV